MTRMLLAYDGTASAVRALALAAAVYRAGDALAVITVTTGREQPAGAATGEVETVGDPATILDEARRQLSEQGLPVRLIRASGDPAAAICSTARSDSYELIVIGSRNIGRAAQALLGSVSDGVAHRAPCDVLIARLGAASRNGAGQPRAAALPTPGQV